MSLLCNRGSDINSNYSSVLPHHELDLCNRPAEYKDGSPNPNHFLFCEVHANYLRNSSGWDLVIAKTLVPLTEDEKMQENAARPSR